jgi:hypothetical protein
MPSSSPLAGYRHRHLEEKLLLSSSYAWRAIVVLNGLDGCFAVTSWWMLCHHCDLLRQSWSRCFLLCRIRCFGRCCKLGLLGWVISFPLSRAALVRFWSFATCSVVM